MAETKAPHTDVGFLEEFMQDVSDMLNTKIRKDLKKKASSAVSEGLSEGIIDGAKKVKKQTINLDEKIEVQMNRQKEIEEEINDLVRIKEGKSGSKKIPIPNNLVERINNTTQNLGENIVELIESSEEILQKPYARLLKRRMDPWDKVINQNPKLWTPYNISIASNEEYQATRMQEITDAWSRFVNIVNSMRNHTDSDVMALDDKLDEDQILSQWDKIYQVIEFMGELSIYSKQFEGIKLPNASGDYKDIFEQMKEFESIFMSFPKESKVRKKYEEAYEQGRTYAKSDIKEDLYGKNADQNIEKLLDKKNKELLKTKQDIIDLEVQKINEIISPDSSLEELNKAKRELYKLKTTYGLFQSKEDNVFEKQEKKMLESWNKINELKKVIQEPVSPISSTNTDQNILNAEQQTFATEERTEALARQEEQAKRTEKAEQDLNNTILNLSKESKKAYNKGKFVESQLYLNSDNDYISDIVEGTVNGIDEEITEELRERIADLGLQIQAGLHTHSSDIATPSYDDFFVFADEALEDITEQYVLGFKEISKIDLKGLSYEEIVQIGRDMANEQTKLFTEMFDISNIEDAMEADRDIDQIASKSLEPLINQLKEIFPNLSEETLQAIKLGLEKSLKLELSKENFVDSNLDEITDLLLGTVKNTLASGTDYNDSKSLSKLDMLYDDTINTVTDSIHNILVGDEARLGGKEVQDKIQLLQREALQSVLSGIGRGNTYSTQKFNPKNKNAAEKINSFVGLSYSGQQSEELKKEKKEAEAASSAQQKLGKARSQTAAEDSGATDEANDLHTEAEEAEQAATAERNLAEARQVNSQQEIPATSQDEPISEINEEAEARANLADKKKKEAESQAALNNQLRSRPESVNESQNNTPAIISVNPSVLNPQEFADKVTSQLNGVSAEISVKPKKFETQEVIESVDELQKGLSDFDESSTPLSSSLQDIQEELRVTSEQSETSTRNITEGLYDVSTAAEEASEKISVVGDKISGIAYHATSADFDKFDISKSKKSQMGSGVYLTPDRNVGTFTPFNDNPNIKEVEVNLEKCFILTKDYITSIKDINDILGTELPDTADASEVLNTIRLFAKKSKENSDAFRQGMLDKGYQGMYAGDYLANKNIESELVIYDESKLDKLRSFTNNELKELKEEPVGLRIEISNPPEINKTASILSTSEGETTKGIVSDIDKVVEKCNELKETNPKAVITDITSSMHKIKDIFESKEFNEENLTDKQLLVLANAFNRIEKATNEEAKEMASGIRKYISDLLNKFGIEIKDLTGVDWNDNYLSGHFVGNGVDESKTGKISKNSEAYIFRNNKLLANPTIHLNNGGSNKDIFKDIFDEYIHGIESLKNKGLNSEQIAQILFGDLKTSEISAILSSKLPLDEIVYQIFKDQVVSSTFANGLDIERIWNDRKENKTPVLSDNTLTSPAISADFEEDIPTLRAYQEVLEDIKDTEQDVVSTPIAPTISADFEESVPALREYKDLVGEAVTGNVTEEQKLLPAVIENNEAIQKRNEELRRMQAIDRAFQQSVNQTNEAKINQDITETLRQRREEQEKLNRAKREEVSSPSPTAENIDIKAEESAKGAEKETEAMTEVKEECAKAATSKKEFAEANAEVLKSIKDSLSGLSDESTFFAALNNIINKLSGKGSAERIGLLAENLNKIRVALSGSIDDNSFITELQKLAESGANLKDLAEVLKASKKGLKKAKDALNEEPEMSQEDRDALAHQIAQAELYEKELKRIAKQEKEINKERERGKKQIEEYNTAVQKQYDKEVKKYASFLDGYINKLDDNLTRDAALKQRGKGVGQDTLDNWKNYKAQLEEIRAELNNKLAANVHIDTAEARDNIDQLIKDIDQSIMSEAKKFEKLADMDSIQKLRDKIEEFAQRNTKISGKYKQDLEDIRNEMSALVEAGKNGNAFEREIVDLDARFRQLSADVKEANMVGKSFGQTILDSLRNANARFLANYLSIQDMIRYLRECVETVRELDRALTEMSKVSDEPLIRLKAYQDTTFDVANEVGSTALTLQQTTADWMRLGESIDDAAESAKAATILLNVSEFENIEGATQALVSASQAYKELDKMEIVDVLNNIGNNYSISTDQLAEGLQNAAAVMKTQGNDLYKAVALLTAGNAITQDISKASTGLRTIALRLSGTEEAKDELVQLGEDVDDFIVGTHAKMQGLIKDYTAVASNTYQGVDILDANGNLKDTYTILLEISKVYQEILDTDKKAGTNRGQALVEAIAGKNRSNIAASILLNPEMLEDVYKTAQNSANSAQNELDKYLNSIDGHIQRFQNALQQLEHDLLDSGLINWFIDFGTSAINAFDKIIEHPLLTGGIFSLITGGIATKKNVGGLKNTSPLLCLAA